MKVGISTATFFTKLLTEDTFSVIQRLKGECCEVFLTTFSEYEDEFVDLLVERLNGLNVYSVHALNTTFEPQLFNTAERTRADAEKTFRKVCKAGQRLGAKVYTFHGPSRLKKNTYYDPEKIGRKMYELGKIAEEYGIKLCFETVHWAAVNSPDFFLKMKEFCPNVGGVLDIKQCRQSGYDLYEYIDVMKDRLENVHLSDVDENDNICMVGKGVFDFDKLIKKLKEVGYDGPLIIEQYSKNYDSLEEVGESVKYLKNILEANK